MLTLTTLVLSLWVSADDPSTQPVLQSAYLGLLKNLGPDRAAFVREQALHWAPRFYVQTEFTRYEDAEGKVHYGVLPEDLIVSLHFDDDDVSNNAENIERIKNIVPDKMPYPMFAEVPFLYRETLTHRFFSFIKYNAKDTGVFGFGAHAHDGEQVWLAIRKDGSRYGKLEVIAMNAHGYPRVYSPDPELEKTMRRNIDNGPLRKKATLIGSEGPWIRTFPGRQQLLENGVPVFVDQGKHALRMCMPEEIDPQSTCVYVCQPTGKAQIKDCMDLGTERPAMLRYSLLPLDSLNQVLYASDDSDTLAARYKIYQSGAEYQTIREGQYTNFWGSFVSAAGRPTVFVKGPADKKPEANFVWDMWMGNTMESVALQPHKALQFLLKNPETKVMPSEEDVSSLYLYNPDLDIQSLNGISEPHREVQTLLNCSTNAWDGDLRRILGGVSESSVAH